MTIAPMIALSCAALGGLSGAASGLRHSIPLAVGGGLLGVLIGALSFLAVTIPYVHWIIRHDSQLLAPAEPPRWWGLLFLPLMGFSLLLATVLPWVAVGWCV